MRKLLIITPHLSTGGAPQVTLNKIELLKDSFDIAVIEYSFLAWKFVIQRNKIIELVGQNFYSLGERKFNELVQIMHKFQPDVISMEEFPEMFMDNECSEYLYNAERNWKIVETTQITYEKTIDHHSSSINRRSSTGDT